MLQGLSHITVAVSDLDRSLDFYSRLLGMTPHARWETGAYLSAGGTWFCLSLGKALPSQDYSHIALDVAPADFELFAERLRAAGVVEWKQNQSEGHSLYLLDPDGHKLEIHSGSLHSRLESLKDRPYPGLVWLE